MAAKVIWSPQAVRDLEQIHEYISRDSVNYASSMIRRILDAVDRLEVFPGMGRVVEDIPDLPPNVRQLVVKPYRIIYRVMGEAVHISAVIHGARSLPDVLKHRSLE